MKVTATHETEREAHPFPKIRHIVVFARVENVYYAVRERREYPVALVSEQLHHTDPSAPFEASVKSGIVILGLEREVAHIIDFHGP